MWTLFARLVVLCGSGALVMAQDGPAARAYTFNTDRVAQPPTGFTFLAARLPRPGRWVVQRNAADGYLVHAADADAPPMGLALGVQDTLTPDNLTVSARVRLAGGVRQGGVAWRVRDADNLYALVLDLDRQDLSLYRITDGNRVRLDVEDGLELDPQAWHTLKVAHDEAEIRVSLGGVRVFEERDRGQQRRAPGDGRVGLVAGGQAEVWFDDLRVDAIRDRR